LTALHSSPLHRGRTRAALEPDQELVVFLIGMRINRLWQPHRWGPVMAAMVAMLRELRQDRSLGLLGTPRTFISGRTLLLVQYWRSHAQLEAYARADDHLHRPAWQRFNRCLRGNGAVGIYHETYRVNTRDVESLYVNMPAFGLGQVAPLQELGRPA
jgi:hypothetical protein